MFDNRSLSIPLYAIDALQFSSSLVTPMRWAVKLRLRVNSFDVPLGGS